MQGNYCSRDASRSIRANATTRFFQPFFLVHLFMPIFPNTHFLGDAWADFHETLPDGVFCFIATCLNFSLPLKGAGTKTCDFFCHFRDTTSS